MGHVLQLLINLILFQIYDVSYNLSVALFLCLIRVQWKRPDHFLSSFSWMIRKRHGHSCKAQHVSVYYRWSISVLYTDFQDPGLSFHWEMIFNISNTRMSIQVSCENDGPNLFGWTQVSHWKFQPMRLILMDLSLYTSGNICDIRVLSSQTLGTLNPNFQPIQKPSSTGSVCTYDPEKYKHLMIPDGHYPMKSLAGFFGGRAMT